MDWLGPCLWLGFLGAILGITLWRGGGLFAGLCYVLSGQGFIALLAGLALVGQKLLDWPASPLVDSARINGAEPWLFGCMLLVYGSVLAALGFVLRILLRTVS